MSIANKNPLITFTVMLCGENLITSIIGLSLMLFSFIVFKIRKNFKIYSKEDLESLLNNDIELNNIITKKKNLDAPYLIGKQNPYTAEYINSYDDMIKYLQMYQFDNQGVDPIENYNKLMEG